MRVSIHADITDVALGFPCQRVEFGDRIYLVSEEIEPPGRIIIVSREKFNRIAPNAERAALKRQVIALILQLDKLRHESAGIHLVTLFQIHRHRRIGLDGPNTVNTGDRGDNDTIIAFQNGARRGVAHPVDLLIHRTVFFNECVGARNIGFGLVIVVIGYEIFNRIVREKALKFGIKLRRERFIWRHNQGRALGRLNNLGHGESFTGPRDAEQYLIPFYRVQPIAELFNRFGLIALWLIL